jgi:small-conductance mechanosensitive channel
MRALASLLTALGVLLSFATASSAVAQTSQPAPAGLSQPQFEALVDAISKSVAERLKAESRPATAPTAGSATPAPTSAAGAESAIAKSLSGGPDGLTLLAHRTTAVLAAVPSIGGELVRIYGLLDQRGNGGVGPGLFLALLLAVAMLAVLGEAVVRRLLHSVQRRLSERADPALGLPSVVALLLLALSDGACVSAMWATGRGGIALLRSLSEPQHRLAVAIMLGIVGWRVVALLLRIVLRPGLAAARLCAVDDEPARRLYRRFIAVALLIIVFRMLGQLMEAVGTAPLTLAAMQAVLVPVYVALLLWLVFSSRTAMQQWLLGLGRSAPLASFVGRHWLPIAAIFFVAVGLTQWHGIAFGHLHVGKAMLTTLDVAIALLLVETLMQAFVRRFDSQLAGYTPASASPKLPDVVARCIRVGILIVAVAIVVESWAVHVLNLIAEKDWDSLTRSTRTAAIALFVAFVLWELFKYVTDPYVLATSGVSATRASAGSPATRLHTMMRLLRTVVAIVLFVIAALVALDDFGVNVTPLIAGASVFGIAVSFGSQALVKDIVSGIFYLYDDAFRVGEYIDCGRAKGTVEGFTVRSIRLRHQDGQVHTIPFGDLGQITNFSRDWTTRKFTLRLARDTDPATLRDVARQIGIEMLERSALKEDIIEPVKMQGIEEVADNALVVRFRFVARPGNPNAVQDEAVTWLLKALPERGIAFAR